MKRDYSGKNFSRKMNKGLLIANVIVFLFAAVALGVAIYHDEVVIFIAMTLVMVASAGNVVMSWLRLKGKKL